MTEPRSILVVDDDLDILEAVEMVLTGAGYRVLVARDGEEALRVLRSQPSLPSLVLLDLMMPGMNGWDFREQQAGDPALSQLPVAVMSGAGRIRDVASALGVRDFLEKPVDVETLLALVQRCCSDACIHDR
jgi:CheY-like chemotaxis protein